MNNDNKLLLWLLAFFVALPIIGLAVSEWRHTDCRMEMAKLNKSVEEIKEICK